jgi:hypothetical protein
MAHPEEIIDLQLFQRTLALTLTVSLGLLLITALISLYIAALNRRARKALADSVAANRALTHQVRDPGRFFAVDRAGSLSVADLAHPLLPQPPPGDRADPGQRAHRPE